MARMSSAVTKQEVPVSAGLLARDVLPKGTQILLGGDALDEANKYTIRLGVFANEAGMQAWHLDSPLGRSLNHSCDPNARLVAPAVQVLPGMASYGQIVLEIIQEVPEGAEVTFDYEANKEPMVAPFECRCGTAQCRGFIGKRES